MQDSRFPDQMNPTDATLWEIKRDPLLRTTIVALALLDRQPDWETFTERVEHTVELLPRLRQRVEEGPMGFGRPHWVDCRPDLTFHLRRTLVAGSGLAGVLELCGHMAGEEFDDARPLWEVVLVEGLAGDRAALILKVSHSLTDGVGGAALLRAFDDDTGDDVLRSMTQAEPRAAPSTIDRISEFLSAPVGLVSTAVEAGLHPIRTIGGSAAAVGSAARLLSPAGPPLSPLMVERGLSRSVGVTEIDLERFRKASHRAGGTINDAFVTVAVGALADYHRALGSEAEHLRLTMPVSFRSDDDAHGGNQWTPARFVLAVDPDGHPYAELQRHRKVLRAAAHEPAISFSQTIAAGVQELPAGLTTGIVAGMVKGSDAALTDIPGMRAPLTIAGSRVTAIHPFAPTGGAAVNIGLFSYVDRAGIGLNMDTAAVAQPALLVDCFEERTSDFLRRRRAPKPKRPPDGTVPDLAPESNARASTHERLSALDTSFLRMESPTTPMHMGGLFIFDGGQLFERDGRFDIDAVREHIAGRLGRFPRLAKRVEEIPLELARPIWVDDPDIDLEHHIQVHALPTPGRRLDLLARCEELQMATLDRNRPLFEFHFLTGLDPVEFGPHAVALVEKVHHALLDGMSSVELMAVLFDADLTDDGPSTAESAVRSSPQWHAAPPGHGRRPDRVRLAAEAIADRLREPAALARLAADAVRSPSTTVARAATVVGAIRDLVRPSPEIAHSLNRPVGSDRVLVPLVVPFGFVHETGAALGSTVNDVVLAAISAGVRALMVARGDSPAGPFTALVPVSTRRLGLEGETGNHVSALVVELPIDDPDPTSAFGTIASRVGELKTQHHADGTEILLEAADHLPPVVVDLVSNLVGRQSFVNLVVTNLPGPPVPLYFRGGMVAEMVPIVPLGGNLTVGVAVLSYAGRLCLAFHADAAACPDVQTMVEATRLAFDDLAEAAGVGTPSADALA